MPVPYMTLHNFSDVTTCYGQAFDALILYLIPQPVVR